MEAVPSDPAARVQLIPVPIVSPGNCGLCGCTNHEVGFADARLDFEWYGTFYLCGTCVGDYARLFGFISTDQYRDLKARYLQTLAELEWYKSHLSEIKDILGARVPAFSVDLSANYDTEPPSDPGLHAAHDEGEPGQVIELPHFHLSGKREADEPVSDEGSDGVSGDTVDDSNGSSDPLGLS